MKTGARIEKSRGRPRILREGSVAFDRCVRQLVARAEETIDAEVLATAARIVEAVRRDGDRALLAAVREHDLGGESRAADGITTVADLRADLGEERGESPDSSAAEDAVGAAFASAVEASIDAVRRFYQPQAEWLRAGDYRVERPGLELEEITEPLRRIGLYVPGGRFPYPSSVIMSVIPAQLAGVEEIVVATPPGALRSPAVRFVLRRLEVTEVWGMGGAQCIAALAHGTETIRPVDLIAGPGNAWVTAAKRQVASRVAIDKEAGPSEVVIVADASANPSWIAADLLAQAEHDPRAMAVLLTPSAELAEAVATACAAQLETLPTAETAAEALAARGAILVTDSLERALEIAEQLAAEHQQLMGGEAEALAPRVRNAGALFVGEHAPTCFGDYAAGPSHVLPTGGAARFASGLSVVDFVRRRHVVRADAVAAASLAETAVAFAEVEGLVGHARSAALRQRTAEAKR